MKKFVEEYISYKITLISCSIMKKVPSTPVCGVLHSERLEALLIFIWADENVPTKGLSCLANQPANLRVRELTLETMGQKGTLVSVALCRNTIKFSRT